MQCPLHNPVTLVKEKPTFRSRLFRTDDLPVMWIFKQIEDSAFHAVPVAGEEVERTVPRYAIYFTLKKTKKRTVRFRVSNMLF